MDTAKLREALHQVMGLSEWPKQTEDGNEELDPGEHAALVLFKLREINGVAYRALNQTEIVSA